MFNVLHFALLVGFLTIQVDSETAPDNNKPPNIIFILSDDQDVILGGFDHMEKTKRLIVDKGITFTNMFVTTPVCSPSRASILTGKYAHNHKVIQNEVDTGNNMSNWLQNLEPVSIPVFLKKKNYTTFFAGKYLNTYGGTGNGGFSHIPPGWDKWYAKGIGDYFYNVEISVNGKLEVTGENYPEDYFPSIIEGYVLEFLRNYSVDDPPFFAMVAPPAAHTPYTPAPQYENYFPDFEAPRNGSYNKFGLDKHWMVRHDAKDLSQEFIDLIDDTYRLRLCSLLSIDDMIENIVQLLEEKGLLDNTYIIYSSDNGYHLGQFTLLPEKRQPYEFDIRVPLAIKGPGITPGVTNENVVLNIDLAPTYLDMAGIPVPQEMDGQSLLPLLHENDQKSHLWRTDFLVEYTGHDVQCDIYCPDTGNNTYDCLRTISPSENQLYCQFKDDEQFEEYYDLESDPDEMENMANKTPCSELEEKRQRLKDLKSCSGLMCF